MNLNPYLPGVEHRIKRLSFLGWQNHRFDLMGLDVSNPVPSGTVMRRASMGLAFIRRLGWCVAAVGFVSDRF
jgi:hypothetical protein